MILKYVLEFAPLCANTLAYIKFAAVLRRCILNFGNVRTRHRPDGPYLLLIVCYTVHCTPYV